MKNSKQKGPIRSQPTKAPADEAKTKSQRDKPIVTRPLRECKKG